jgi:hypothetical protein
VPTTNIVSQPTASPAHRSVRTASIRRQLLEPGCAIGNGQ